MLFLFQVFIGISTLSLGGWLEGAKSRCDRALRSTHRPVDWRIIPTSSGSALTVSVSGIFWGSKPLASLILGGDFVADLGHVNVPTLPFTATRPETALIETNKGFDFIGLGPGARIAHFGRLTFTELAGYAEGSAPVFAQLVESAYADEVETTEASGKAALVGAGAGHLLRGTRPEEGPKRTQALIAFANGFVVAANIHDSEITIRRMGQVLDPAWVASTRPSFSFTPIWQHAEAVVFYSSNELNLFLFRGERSGHMRAQLPTDDTGSIEYVSGETFDLTAGSSAALHGGGVYVGTGRVIAKTQKWINYFRVKDGRLEFEERIPRNRLTNFLIQ